jgi:hypothetical protein
MRRNAAMNRTENLNVTFYEEATFGVIDDACSCCKALATG